MTQPSAGYEPVLKTEITNRIGMITLNRPARRNALNGELIAALDGAVKAPGRPDGFTRRLDRVVLHPVLGLVILLAILFLMFQAVFTWAQTPMDLIKSGFDGLAAWAGPVVPQGWLLSFVRDGVISGVGSVLVFLPQILTLFLFILLLEDFGYMARAAFLMDRIMGSAGLHVRAFIPLLSSFACAIPALWQRGSSPAAADASPRSSLRR